MGRARKLLALAAPERALLVQAWALLVVADLALRSLSPARVLALPARALGRPRPAGTEPDARRLGWLVSVAARHAPVDATCLTQALVVAWLLARRGVPATVRIGVARRDGALGAHAWVERDGAVVFDTAGADRYEALR